MRFFAPPTPLVLFSEFDPDECRCRLRESIDPEQRTIFGFSGYRGTKPFLGEVNGKQFRILQRVYSNRSSLPPVLTGEFKPQESGTRVEGTFDLELTSKIAICVFGVFGLLIVALVAILSYASHPVLSVAFACGYGSLLICSPRIFRGMGLDQEKSVAAFIKETLIANGGPSSSAPDCDS